MTAQQSRRLTDPEIRARGLLTPAEQEQRWGEAISNRPFKCDKCKEVASVSTKTGGHLCLQHMEGER